MTYFLTNCFIRLSIILASCYTLDDICVKKYSTSLMFTSRRKRKWCFKVNLSAFISSKTENKTKWKSEFDCFHVNSELDTQPLLSQAVCRL